jgi:hypothetical protein
MDLQPCVGPSPLFQFHNSIHNPWTREQPVARPLPAHMTAQTQNKRTETTMPQVGVEPTIPVFERAKTVHDIDRAAAVNGKFRYYLKENT